MTLSPFALRMRLAFETLGIPRKEFARLAEFPYKTIIKWTGLREDKTPDVHITRRLCERLSEQGLICDQRWLLTGEGVLPYRRETNPYGSHLEWFLLPDKRWIWNQRTQSPELGIWMRLNVLSEELTKEKIHHKIMRVRDNTMGSYIKEGTYIISGVLPCGSPSTGLVCVGLHNGQHHLRLQTMIEGKKMYFSPHKGVFPPEEVTEVLPVLWVGFY